MTAEKALAIVVIHQARERAIAAERECAELIARASKRPRRTR
jgi:hypothetical protein